MIRETSLNNGFTLIELVIVVLIIAFLLALGTLQFNNMQVKNSIERETRELYVDVNNARTYALYRKEPYAILLNSATNYIFKSYSSVNESQSAGKVIFSKNISYKLTGFTPGTYLQFGTSGGLSSPGLTIYVNPAFSGAAFDCINVDTVLTHLGNTANGPICNQK